MTAPGQRSTSLDAFRGFAIAGMVLVNDPGDWSQLYAPLAHARWHGWTFTDWIFPFFLFIVGTSMSLSTARRAAAGVAPAQLLAALARRAAVLFAIGVALNLLPSFDLAHVRIPGVLQRIALASLIAAPAVLWAASWRAVAAAIVALFVVYSVPMLYWPVPDASGIVAAGALEPGRDFGAAIDRLLLGGHLWSQSRTWDPEGLWSTLPAAATVLFGALAGRGLGVGGPAPPRAAAPTAPATPAERTVWLLLGGLALVWLGSVLDVVLMPINKSLWTPSYAVFTAGWACVVFGACHWLLDAAPRPRLREHARRWLQPLVVFGVNALAVFVVAGVVGRLLVTVRLPRDGGSVTLKAWLYEPLRALPLPPPATSLLYAVLFTAVMYAFAWALWKRRWFIKV